jgi:hypothetical protein
MAYPLFMGIQTLFDSQHGRNRIVSSLQNGYEGVRKRFNQIDGFTNPFTNSLPHPTYPKARVVSNST